MKTIIEYFSNYSLTDFFYALLLIGAAILCFDKSYKWLKATFQNFHNKMKEKEEELSVLTKNVAEIRSFSDKIDELGNLVNKQYLHLEKKIEEQVNRLDLIEKQGKNRDAAILRDRLIQALRFFGNKVDKDNVVHIGVTDHENLTHLFEEYFACGGNGTIESMFKNEFKTWIIDK